MLTREKKIKEFWESTVPNSDKNLGYEKEREARYAVYPYMHSVFPFDSCRDKRVLEVGCGAGVDSAEFARNGAIVTSVDFTVNAVTHASHTRKEAIELKLVRMLLPWVIYLEDATNMKFKSNSFDVVYSFGVLHHIPEVKLALKECYRVLKEGGTFTGMVYNRNSLLYAFSILYLHGIDKNGKWLGIDTDKLVSMYSERVEGCPYTKAYSILEWIDLLEQAGFQDIDMSIHCNAIDTPYQRKLKLDIPDEYGLGWHLVFKAVK